MKPTRRGFLGALAGLAVAPNVVKASPLPKPPAVSGSTMRLPRQRFVSYLDGHYTDAAKLLEEGTEPPLVTFTVVNTGRDKR